MDGEKSCATKELKKSERIGSQCSAIHARIGSLLEDAQYLHATVYGRNYVTPPCETSPEDEPAGLLDSTLTSLRRAMEGLDEVASVLVSLREQL